MPPPPPRKNRQISSFAKNFGGENCQNTHFVRIFGRGLTSFNHRLRLTLVKLKFKAQGFLKLFKNINSNAKAFEGKSFAFSMIEILIAFAVVSVAILAFTPLMTKKLKTSSKTNKNCKNGIEFREEILTTANFGTEEKKWIPTDSEGHEAELVNTMTVTMVGGGGGGGAGFKYNEKEDQGTSLTAASYEASYDSGVTLKGGKIPKIKYYFIASDIDLISISDGGYLNCGEYLKDTQGRNVCKTICNHTTGMCPYNYKDSCTEYETNINKRGSCEGYIDPTISYCEKWSSNKCLEHSTEHKFYLGYAGCSVEKNVALSSETEFGTYTISGYSINLNNINVSAPAVNQQTGSCTDKNGMVCEVGTPNCKGEAKAGNFQYVGNILFTQEELFLPNTLIGIDGTYGYWDKGQWLYYGTGADSEADPGKSRKNGIAAIHFTPARAGYGGGGGGVLKFVVVAGFNTKDFVIKVGNGGESGKGGENTTLNIGNLGTFTASGGGVGQNGNFVGQHPGSWQRILKETDSDWKNYAKSETCKDDKCLVTGGNGGGGFIPAANGNKNLVTWESYEGYNGTPPFKSKKGERSKDSPSIAGGQGGGINYDAIKTTGGLGGCDNVTSASKCTDINGKKGEGYGAGGGGGSCNKESCGTGGEGADGMIKIEYQVKCKE